MKNKIKITIIIFGILLIGIVTANLIPNLSNAIFGNVKVTGPVFYFEANDESLYKNLLLNEIPSVENDTRLFNGNRLLYESESLGLTEIYPARFEVHIWSRTNFEGNILQFRILKINNFGIETEICSPNYVQPNHKISFTERITSCNSTGKIYLNTTDKIALEIRGSGGTSEYWISSGEKYTHGYSRIEISKQ